MSLIHSDPSHGRRRASYEPTRHPAVCLIGGFAFLVFVGVTVHFAFTLI